MEEKKIIKFNIEPPSEERAKELIRELKEQFKKRKIVLNKDNKTSDELIKRLPFTLKCYGKDNQDE